MNAGRLLILPKGEYDSNLTYTVLDVVTCDGLPWMCKKTAKGIRPSDEHTEYWQKLFDITEASKNLIDEKINEYFDGAIPIEHGGTGAKTTEDAVKNLGLQYKGNIEILHYTGTGLSGENNPCHVTCSFVPKVLIMLVWHSNSLETSVSQEGMFSSSANMYGNNIIYCDWLKSEYGLGAGFWNTAGSTSCLPYAKKSEDGKTIYWYTKQGNASEQFNEAGAVYEILAIG